MEQMTIFDLLYPERIDPLREVARNASVCWTKSKEKLRNLYEKRPTRDTWTEAVRHEYSPYGFAGHYGGRGANSVHAWCLKTKTVEVEWQDEEGKEHKMTRSWADFAEKVAQLIEEGSY